MEGLKNLGIIASVFLVVLGIWAFGQVPVQAQSRGKLPQICIPAVNRLQPGTYMVIYDPQLNSCIIVDISAYPEEEVSEAIKRQSEQGKRVYLVKVPDRNRNRT